MTIEEVVQSLLARIASRQISVVTEDEIVEVLAGSDSEPTIVLRATASMMAREVCMRVGEVIQAHPRDPEHPELLEGIPIDFSKCPPIPSPRRVLSLPVFVCWSPSRFDYEEAQTPNEGPKELGADYDPNFLPIPNQQSSLKN